MQMRQMIRAARAYRELLLNDPYRPIYHFAVPDDDGRPGDPNGCFYADGRHHMMYLYRRDEGAFHWGHVSSADMLHWRHHPDCLIKGEMDEGCFSGGAFVDDDGTAYLSYWIYNDGAKTDGRNAGIGIAKAAPPYDHFERLPEVCIPSTEWGILDAPDGEGGVRHLGCADPSNIWKRDGVYYMQTGNLCVLNKYGRETDSPAEMRGDWTELFSSNDMHNWKYEGRFYERREDNAWTDETEDDMCPSFLPLPKSSDGGEMSDKHLQLFIAHNKGCQYYIGQYQGNRFTPERHGRMSWMDNSYFAPEAYIDGRGRQIVFAWLLDNLEEDFKTYGWSGVFSLPRTVWLMEDGNLGIAPVEELKALRINPQAFDDFTLTDEIRALDVKNGDACELELTIDMAEAGQAGVVVRESADGAERTRIYYDRAEKALIFDATRSGSPSRNIIERAPFELAEGEELRLRVFIDRAVVEVFANDRQAICRRVFNQIPGSTGISAFSSGRSGFTLKAWEMMAALPY